MIELRVNTTRPGFHRWPDAPPHRAYLGLRHQHTFFFEVYIPVAKADRDLEFHDERERLECIVEKMFPNGEFGDKSCESIAIDVLREMPEADSARVGEDPQHCAYVTRDGVTNLSPRNGRLHVVTVCGSTKFKDETRQALVDLEDEGLAALSVGGFSHASAPYSPEAKARYDALHKDKIRMSDSIYVVNPDGYIGESTAGEILLAHSLRVPVRFRYPKFAVDLDALDAFRERMAKKLLKNASKGGWDHESMEDLVAGIERELSEMKQAIANGEAGPRIANEAADVANYCMMVADRFDGRQRIR
jgi:hypothetical protein